MSTEDTRPTVDEFIDSLTGFEEIAIKSAFGAKPIELGEVDKMGLIRSLYFANQRREGLKDKEAKDAALAATIGEVNSMFADDEPVPDDPITESGKDTREPSLTPSDSPTSASEPASSLPSTQP